MKKIILLSFLVYLTGSSMLSGMDGSAVLDPKKYSFYSNEPYYLPLPEPQTNNDSSLHMTDRECYCNITHCCNSCWNYLRTLWCIVSYCCTKCNAARE